MTDADPLDAVPRLNADQLTQFALNCLDGHIFTSAQVDPEDLGYVFLLVGLGMFPAAVSPAYLEQIGVVYEYLEKALPRSINGLPTFGSMHILHKDDWAIAHATIVKEIARRNALKLGQPE